MGRQKGVPNRKTESLVEQCTAQGVDVWGSMLLQLKNMKDGPEVFTALEKLAQYIYPKRKALEVDASVNLELAKQKEEIDAMDDATKLKIHKEAVLELEKKLSRRERND